MRICCRAGQTLNMGSRGLVIAAACVGVVAVLGIAAVALSEIEPDAAQAIPSSADSTPFTVHVDEYGVLLGIRPAFSEDRLLTGGTITVNGMPDEGVSFWSRKFDDHFPPPDPFPVRADERVLIEGRVDPACDDDSDVPVIAVWSRTRYGSERVDHYRPDSLTEYREAVTTWCAMGASVIVGGSTQHPNGDFTVTLNLFNPTSEPVTVESAAMTLDGTTWRSASIVVAAHSREDLVLRGHGEGCSSENPWSTGRVTIDGVPAELEEWASEQC